ncbi:MAG: branched-chain amino acid ABC transporter substrate-binding protein [Anaerolineae bacterium]
MRNLVLILLVFSLLLAGCNANPQPTRGEVTVFVAVPLSGFQANGGQTVLGGVRLAAEEINRQGGLLGYKVVVIGLDDESDSDVALAGAEKVKEALASGQKVLGVVGHLNSGQTLAAMEVYKDLPLIIITPTSSETSITQKGYRNFFRVNANDTVQAAVDAGFLVNNLKAKRIAIVHNDTPYGIGLRNEMQKALASVGAEVVLALQVKEGQARYLDEVAQIKAANPDAIFYAGYEIEAPYLRADLVENGVTTPLLASDGAFLAATIDEANGTAEGMYVSAFAPSPQVAGQPWIQAYQAVESRNPDTYSVNGYSAMAVLAEGVKKANSLDVTKISDAMRQIDFRGVMGELQFDVNGDVKNPKVFIFQVRDSQFVQVAP